MASETDSGQSGAPSARTLVIIPTYNERENLGLIVGRLHAALPRTHVLVVDDGSPDGTGDIADALASNDEAGRIHVMHRTEKNGLGAAYIAGFHWGGLDRDYTVLVEMDADGSHAPEQLHRLLDQVDAAPTLCSVRGTCRAARWSTGRSTASGSRAAGTSTRGSPWA